MIANDGIDRKIERNAALDLEMAPKRQSDRSRNGMSGVILTCRFVAAMLAATVGTACVPVTQFMTGITGPVAGAPVEPDPNADTIARARAARANGELETAVRLYRAALPSTSTNLALRVELGETLTDAGDYEQAYEAIDQALRQSTGEAREAGYVALGRLFFKLRRSTESADFFEKALAENPRNLRAMIGRGVALDLTGRFEQAQAAYLQALELAPGDLRAQNNLALSYAFAGNFARAVEIMHPMATAPTATPRLRQNLALIYGLMGNGELAASISRRDLDEATIQSNLRFYELLRRMPNPAEAVAGIGT